MQLIYPSNRGLTALRLGHRGEQTMLNHYSRSGATAAGARWQNIVKRMR